MKEELFNDLKKEVLEIQDRYPKLSSDNAFVVWFLRAFITEDEKNAFQSITGRASDKNSDAVYIDNDNRLCFVIQGKYHQTSEPNVSRSDILTFVDMGKCLVSDKKNFESLLNNANSTVTESFKKVRNLVLKNNYTVVLIFVTTGKISNTNIEDAETRLDNYDNIRFENYSRSDLMKLMQDYIEGAAPPVPVISLPVQGSEVFTRDDTNTGISSWLFTMAGKDISKIFNNVGIRLFARNIRGYLGANKEVNKMIKYTIDKEPQYFWYYNNGITIVCDDARQIKKGSSNIIKVSNAQIINGQQTTRTLALVERNNAEVLIKLIVLSRNSDDGKNQFKHIVSEIVSATNWQNSISQADLKSNDAEQVRIEREFKKHDYFYIRKEMTKSEASKYGADKCSFRIKKAVLARAIAAVRLDPYEIRLGKDNLFEDSVYGKIFDGRNALEYITIYWLFKLVDYWGRTNDKYSYAKWLVLNLLWDEIGNDLRNINNREAFRFYSERNKSYSKEFRHLDNLIKLLFQSALSFYSKNKKNTGKVQEPINFFKHTNLHKELRKFYDKQPGRIKKKANRSKTLFFKTLEEYWNK